jgi:hypothetical protein
MNPDNIQKIKDCFTKRAQIEELNNEERDKREKEILDRKYKLINEIKSYFKDLPFDTYFNVKITTPDYKWAKLSEFIEDWALRRRGYWDPIHHRLTRRPIYISILIRDIQFLDNRVTIRMAENKITGQGSDNALWVLNSYWEENELIRLKKMLPWIEKQLVKDYGCQ